MAVMGRPLKKRPVASACLRPRSLKPKRGRRPYRMSLGLCTSAWLTTRISVRTGACTMASGVDLKSFSVGSFDNNVYILVDQATGVSVLFDAPTDAPRILRELEGTNLKYILMTHADGDHVQALEAVKSTTGVPI